MEDDKKAPLGVGLDGDKTSPRQEGGVEKINGFSEEGNGKNLAKFDDDLDDGAAEKLVSEDAKIAVISSKNISEVKFNFNDSQNGDVKIDIDTVQLAFAGMGKQELMKFANDPFWVRMRWFLFIFFWLIWAAMLVGAIAIVIIAPKCSSPAPLVWWEKSPLYNVDVRSYKDGSEPQDGIGDLKGLLSKLDYIGELGVKGVTISSILKSSDPNTDDTVENFQEIDPIFGSLGDFKALITEMKSRGLHLVMSIILNHSSNKHPWFIQSERKDTPFSDYYIWAPSSGQGADAQNYPPNNWLSILGGSAWEWSETRKEFYLHQFRKDQPDLNFRNPAVVEELKNILKFWLDLGVSGFQLEKVQYLLEDVSLKNESLGKKPGPTHDEYDFYSHRQTSNFPEVFEILSILKQAVKNSTGSDGLLSMTGHIPSATLAALSGDQAIDLPQNADLFTRLKPGFSGDDLVRRVQQWLAVIPETGRASWQLGDSTTSRVTSRLSADDVDGLNMAVMLLPGTPITQYGDELGMDDSSTADARLKGRAPMQWSNTTNAGFSDSPSPWVQISYNYETSNVLYELQAAESPLKVYKSLVEARNSPSIMFGATDINSTANGTVFTFSRIKSGNPGYLVAFNTADRAVVADLTVLGSVSGELTVAIRSSNMKNEDIGIKSKWPADAVPLPAKGALVLTFVPKKAE